MKTVLMIAYHFPPVAGSSGVQRVLRFSNYLLDHDWQPIVLTVNPAAYSETNKVALSEVRDGVKTYRCWALDAARHLSIKGKYPDFLSRPDRWSSWQISGVLVGRYLIRRYAPKLIWSTFPIATASVVAEKLARYSGLPWVADFRDMMVDVGYPTDPALREYVSKIEARVVSQADKVVFTTEGTRSLYECRYPDLGSDRWSCIRNGFDHESIEAARNSEIGQGKHISNDSCVRLIHSGILYPSERDPSCFFRAIAALKESGDLKPRKLSVVLRATGHDEIHQREISRLGIDDVVSLAPTIAYREALAEMLSADGLLLFQASNCNNQIPAKLYEYFAAEKPILGLVDLQGETAQTMREAGMNDLADISDSEAIGIRLLEFLDAIKLGTSATVSQNDALKYSRKNQTAELAELFNKLSQGHS